MEREKNKRNKILHVMFDRIRIWLTTTSFLFSIASMKTPPGKKKKKMFYSSNPFLNVLILLAVLILIGVVAYVIFTLQRRVYRIERHLHLTPKRGKPGKPGEKGPKGDPGKVRVDVIVILPFFTVAFPFDLIFFLCLSVCVSVCEHVSGWNGN